MAIGKYVANGVKHLLKNGDEVVKNGVKNGTKNGANGAVKKAAKRAPKSPPRVLNKADYEGNSLNKFGYNKRDWVTLSDQSASKPKPLFRDEGGDLYYHQSNGNTPSQFRKRDTKQQEVFDRDQKGATQTKKEVQGTFLKDRPQRADSEAHHIAPVKSLAFLFDGLDESDSRKMINHFEKRGVYIGNDPRNRADLTSATHTSVHESYVKKAILKYNHASLEGMTLKERIKFANVILQEIKEAKKIVDQYNEPWITNDQLMKSFDRLARPELAGYE